ncbi:prepilin-type N-terminal cleavage/methylation domain-containing protein [Oryzibacter oryziterrae]|uniref:prepilin-type N-terminal cleavage/methylation domain-containing protein n=1 Tax=Oryzibacter oryziterrae TaxID=2766474 RepID=UPI001F375C4E|nr:prepilin-type N-terminal cleavage/methylation domain-containing protein [Oryzibacter oryziterrae]
MKRRDANDGFTLLETLVALVVASLVLSVMTVLISSLTDLRHRFSRVDAARQELTTTHDVLAELFAAALPGRPDAGTAGGTDVTLTLLSRGTTIMLEPSHAAFTLASDRSGHLALSWLPASGARTESRVLLPTASRFAFRYLLADPNGNTPAWSAVWTTPDVLPLAIELTVAYADVDTPFTLLFATHERYPYACDRDPTLSPCGEMHGRP